MERVIVFDPVPVPDEYTWDFLDPCVPPSTLVLEIESEEESPQLIKKVAVTSFAFVVLLSTYIVSFMFASVITVPPDETLYMLKSAFGSDVYNVIKSVTECDAELPEPLAEVFLAVTVTSKGDDALLEYVWLGVLSVVLFDQLPSPQLISK